MIKIDKTLLNLSDVFSYMSVAKTLSILESFTQSKKSLEKNKEFFVANAFEFGQYVDMIAMLAEQIKYLDKNIKTLTTALLAHESKVIEKRLDLKELQVICLN